MKASPTLDSAGWRAIVEICDDLAVEAERLAEGIIERIRAEVHGYDRIVPIEDMRNVVRHHCEQMLNGLAHARGPTVEELSDARQIGRRRAAQGLPVHELLQAYQIGQNAVWIELVERSDHNDLETTRALAYAAERLWSWMHELTVTVAHAHATALRVHEAVQASLRHRFFDALLSGLASADSTHGLCEALQLEPAGLFQAACVPNVAAPHSTADQLQTEMREQAGSIHCVARGNEVIVLVQANSVDRIRNRLCAASTGRVIGVGLPRHGLLGAAESLVDAQRCAALAASTGRSVDFSRDWLAATMVPSLGRLRVMLEPGRETARRFPDLAKTVRAFAEHGFNATTVGKELFIHPNTVAYRLGRWAELTGWDPHTSVGLTRSLLSLSLSPACAEDSARSERPANTSRPDRREPRPTDTAVRTTRLAEAGPQ